MADEQIVITKSELMELMGQLALPPFEGHPEASEWDCAPLAENISKVVDDFFNSKLPGGTHTPGEQVHTRTTVYSPEYMAAGLKEGEK